MFADPRVTHQVRQIDDGLGADASLAQAVHPVRYRALRERGFEVPDSDAGPEEFLEFRPIGFARGEKEEPAVVGLVEPLQRSAAQCLPATWLVVRGTGIVERIDRLMVRRGLAER